MARKVVHQLVDDISGSVLEAGEGETVSFSVDGRSFEIDLSATNAAALREVFAPYVAAGRRVAGGRSSRRRGGSSRRGASEELSAIRAWARENGYKVSNRGRVSAAIVAAYEAR